MNWVKSFDDFVNETYLDKTTDPKLLNYDEKKMKKNGYIEVELLNPVEGLKKGDILLVSANEIGQLENESLITCWLKNKKIIIPKKDIKIVK
jgi:hypothetical protein